MEICRQGTAKKTWHMTQLTFSSNFYWKICFKFCILEQLIATVLFICISSINNKRSLLRFQSTTAPTNRGWSACGVSALMLSGEGNAGERWKTTIGPISEKSNFARAAHFFCTFLCRCFARLQRETSRNFLVTRFTEEMYVFSFHHKPQRSGT